MGDACPGSTGPYSEGFHIEAYQKALRRYQRKMVTTRSGAAGEKGTAEMAGKQPRKRKRQDDEESECEVDGDVDEDWVEEDQAEDQDQDQGAHEDRTGDEDGEESGDEDAEEGVKLECSFPMDKLYFVSWAEFDAYRLAYMNATSTRVVTHTTDNCALRNKKIMKQVGVQKGTVVPDLVPMEFEVWRRGFKCTHSWKDRNRGSGKRPRRKLRALPQACPFRFTVEVVRPPDGSDTWILAVKNAQWGHNHRVSADVYAQYSQNRQIPEWEHIWNDLRLMFRCGGKTIRMWEYIRDHSQYKVTMQDVHNIVAKIRAEYRGKSDDVAVADWLMGYQMRHPGNCVGVVETAKAETGVICWSSNHMRVMFDRFPEVLLMDCTHKTNK